MNGEDFAEGRDPKKVSRMLSWLFQFVETLEPAHKYTSEVLRSMKGKNLEAVELRRKIATLKTSSESDEEKRMDYQKRIAELRSALSEKSGLKVKISEEVSAETSKLTHLMESEKAKSLEATKLMSKLEELKCSEENLRVKVIDNPNLPQTMRELQEKNNALELEMQEVMSKTHQVEKSISDYKQLHEVIKRQLVSICKDCNSLLLQISHSKSDFQKSSQNFADRSAELGDLNKKLTDVTDCLRLLEHEVVKERVAEATEVMNEEQGRKEKTGLLEKYRNVYKSLESDVDMLNALVETAKASYEKEYNNEERGEREKKMEEMTNALQKLYRAYTQE
ncbi:hypothetical protein Aperf_G00000034138 [Anoplocephala perfoliata]